MKTPQLVVYVFFALLLAYSRADAHEDEVLRSGSTDRLGEVNFPISCGRPAQEQFNQAVAMLHSFFYLEASKSFAKVTELDPTCAMGYWGIAMSHWYPLWFPPSPAALTTSVAASRIGSAPPVSISTPRPTTRRQPMTPESAGGERAADRRPR